MMAEMTAIERIDKHVNLEQPDRVGIAPFGEFYYGGLVDMTIEDLLMDPWKADQAFEAGQLVVRTLLEQLNSHHAGPDLDGLGPFRGQNRGRPADRLPKPDTQAVLNMKTPTLSADLVKQDAAVRQNPIHIQYKQADVVVRHEQIPREGHK